VTERHLDAMASMLVAPPGKRLHLPKGIGLITEYGKLRVGRGLADTCPLPPLEGVHSLAVPGVTRVGGWPPARTGGWLVWAEALDAPPAEFPDGVREACLDWDAVGARLQVRSRKPGDRFQPLGMTGEKKLQDFFVERKVPRAWRDNVPLVVGERGIAWVVGYRIAHWARVTSETKRVVRLELSQTQGTFAPTAE